MPTLLLLNGPPASGKSTLARRLVVGRPLALTLDIDVLRGQMGGWLAEPEAAGNAARDIAIATCRVHLTAGHDVVVPQFLERPEFVDRLAAVAAEADAEFVHVVLEMTRADAVRAFNERRSNPTDPTHHDAAALVDRSLGDDPVGAMYDALQVVIEQRSSAIRFETTRGNIERTVDDLHSVISSAAPSWRR